MSDEQAQETLWIRGACLLGFAEYLGAPERIRMDSAGHVYIVRDGAGAETLAGTLTSAGQSLDVGGAMVSRHPGGLWSVRVLFGPFDD